MPDENTRSDPSSLTVAELRARWSRGSIEPFGSVITCYRFWPASDIGGPPSELDLEVFAFTECPRCRVAAAPCAPDEHSPEEGLPSWWRFWLKDLVLPSEMAWDDIVDGQSAEPISEEIPAEFGHWVEALSNVVGSDA